MKHAYKNRWQDKTFLTLFIVLVIMSIGSFAYFYNQGLITSIIDTKSKLMIARSVIDGNMAGFSQLGGIWLPLPQILMIPFIWIDFLYITGIAGSVISMASYIASALFLYKLIVEMTRDRAAAFIGIIIFSNPNMLFLQSLPLSETLFLLFFIMTVYFLVKWIEDVERIRYLFFTALSIFFATLTRYEGWVLLFLVFIVLLFVFRGKKFTFVKSEGHLIFFLVLALFGVLLWFIWNRVIFGDFLFFIRSEYATARISAIENQSLDPSLRISGNFLKAVQVYIMTVLDVGGWVTVILSIVGIIYLFLFKNLNLKRLAVIIFLFPLIFYIPGLFYKASIIIKHPDIMAGHYSNLRYGIMMMPAVGFFTAFLIQRGKWKKIVMVFLIVASIYLTWIGGVIVVEEANNISMSVENQVNESAGEWLTENYDGGRLLMQRFRNETVTFIFSSEYGLDEIVYEGNPVLWEDSLEKPADNVRWIFMRDNETLLKDKAWNQLHDSLTIQNDYELVHFQENMKIYKLKQ